LLSASQASSTYLLASFQVKERINYSLISNYRRLSSGTGFSEGYDEKMQKMHKDKTEVMVVVSA
jgi:hypothetical protein